MGTTQSKISNNKRNNSFKRLKNKPRQKNENITEVHSSNQETTDLITLTNFPSANDDIDYLHQHHFIVKTIWSSNFSSPIIDSLKTGATILDVRCGAGTFLLELSNEYPLSDFIGIDKSKLFPALIKPNNLNFIHADIIEGLPFQDNHFDFVYLNIIEPRYTLNQLNFIIGEFIRVAKPGGYIEIQGFDSFAGTVGPHFLNFIRKFSKLFAINGIEMGSRHRICSLLSANPFFNSDHRRIQIGKNGGNIGVILEQHSTMFFIDIIGEALANISNISIDELKQDWKEVLKEFDEVKTSLEIYRMWVMKT